MEVIALKGICIYPITISTQYNPIACIELKSNITIAPNSAKIIADKLIKTLLKNNQINNLLLDKIYIIHMKIDDIPEAVLTVSIKHYIDIDVISKYINIIYTFDTYTPGQNINELL